MKKNVIFDGDMGGDDLWAIALLLAHREKLNILGISTVFGNVSLTQATKVVLGFLKWMNFTDIDVAAGCTKARDNINPLGDNAFGEDGVGGLIFPNTSQKPYRGNIADWYKKKIEGEKNPVTVLVTGPLTNIAFVIEKYPALKKKIREIIWMGAALHPPGKNGKPVFKHGIARAGNITWHAEFNAYMDPKAVNDVIRSKIPMTIMPMDATQNMVLTKTRQQSVKTMHPKFGDGFLKMQMVVAELDKMKFGVSGPFIHDPHVVAYFLSPRFYKTKKLEGISFIEEKPSNEFGKRGKFVFGKHKTSVKWVSNIKNQKEVFIFLKNGLKKTIKDAT